MNELMILNEDNVETKTYAIYYTINERFYIIYTAKEKDENNYVVLHIAKVLKEVNNTEDGIVPTGKYIGLEISDQSEWDNAKINIGEIVSNKQNNTPTSVSYLPVGEINGISIKSSKTFKLREDVVDSIIVESNNNVEAVMTESPVSEEPVALASIEEPATPEVESVAPIAEEVGELPITVAPIDNIEPAIEVVPEEPVASEIEEDTVNDFATPALAPNPFEMQPEVEIPAPVVNEEPAPINPYEVMQQQRAEEMVNALATDNMQDIVASPVLSVSDLESKVEETPTVEVEENIPVETTQEPAVNVFETEPEIEVAPEVEPAAETIIETPEEVVEEEKVETPTIPEAKEEVISSESFVDSIVADVSDILDKKEEQTVEEKEDYERLYNDALEKTVELEKELAELHSKLNNIKNIIE